MDDYENNQWEVTAGRHSALRVLTLILTDSQVTSIPFCILQMHFTD